MPRRFGELLGNGEVNRFSIDDYALFSFKLTMELVFRAMTRPTANRRKLYMHLFEAIMEFGRTMSRETHEDFEMDDCWDYPTFAEKNRARYGETIAMGNFFGMDRSFESQELKDAKQKLRVAVREAEIDWERTYNDHFHILASLQRHLTYIRTFV